MKSNPFDNLFEKEEPVATDDKLKMENREARRLRKEL